MGAAEVMLEGLRSRAMKDIPVTFNMTGGGRCQNGVIKLDNQIERSRLTRWGAVGEGRHGEDGSGVGGEGGGWASAVFRPIVGGPERKPSAMMEVWGSPAVAVLPYVKLYSLPTELRCTS